MIRWFLLVPVLVSPIGCASEPASQPAAEPKPEPAAETIRSTHPSRGQVVAVEEGGAKLRIAHEKMEGFMDAMTMPFDVHSPAESEGLAAGDKIAFSFVLTNRRSYIHKIERLPAETELTLAGTASTSP